MGISVCSAPLLLGIAIASICLLLGAVLLYDGGSDTNQTLRLVGGAAILSLGLTTISLVLKNQLEWKRNRKKYRER